jgi:3-methyladenine DNA glycosylase AlkD
MYGLMNALIPEIQRSLAQMPAHNASTFRLVRREWSRKLNATSGRSVIALARDLISLGGWERLLAYEVLANHPEAINSLTPKDVTALGRGIQSWGEVDCFAAYVAGPAWREGSVPTRLIQSWARSDDHWWRRAAVVSTVPLNNRARGGKGDARRTLGICGLVIGDRHDMVIKALSWALRELSKREKPAVESFIDRHSQELAPRVLREVRNKMQTGLKNPRRR